MDFDTKGCVLFKPDCPLQHCYNWQQEAEVGCKASDEDKGFRLTAVRLVDRLFLAVMARALHNHIMKRVSKSEQMQ